MKFDYDVIVIGGGAAGLTSSKLANGLNKRVALIERDKLGGECTWTGCIPSKTIIKIADAVHAAQTVQRFGIQGKTPEYDLSGVFPYVRKVIDTVAQMNTPQAMQEHGIDILYGSPVFYDNHVIEMQGKRLSAASYIIATGSRPLLPKIKGLDAVSYLTNQTLFNIDKIPKSLAILGGGVIGVEIACAFSRLGCKVTIIERHERILLSDDEEVVAVLMEHMRKEGITLLCSTRALEIVTHGNQKKVICSMADDAPHEVIAEEILVATGRVANTDSLGLEKAGVALTKNRSIQADTTMRTTARNIYTCGDVVGPYLFSHMAWNQAVVAARNACFPYFKKHITYDNVVWVTFASPELAGAGMTEAEARERYGDAIRVYKTPYDDIDRSIVDGVSAGLGKFICDSRGYLLGAYIIGPRAGEVIHEIMVGKQYGVKFQDFSKVTHAYPTYSEVVWNASRDAYLEKLTSNPWIRLARWLTIKKRTTNNKNKH